MVLSATNCGSHGLAQPGSPFIRTYCREHSCLTNSTCYTFASSGGSPGHISLGLFPVNDWAHQSYYKHSHSYQIRASSKGQQSQGLPNNLAETFLGICCMQYDALPTQTFLPFLLPHSQTCTAVWKVSLLSTKGVSPNKSLAETKSYSGIWFLEHSNWNRKLCRILLLQYSVKV